DDADTSPLTPATSLPAACIVGAVTWEIESVVRSALEGVQVPEGCPPNRLFVPILLRSRVIQWGHTTKLTCHPGVGRTLRFLHQSFWWSAMGREVREFIAACPVRSQNKSSRHPPAGLLHPLPIPRRPWSHISVDFVTGLPVSEGNTTILSIIDCFSKMAHFVALSKLPSAKETAEVLLSNVFRLHGLPQDIVSDGGPQFTSHFWKEFCSLIGPQSACRLGFVHSPMDRLRDTTRRWRQDYTVWLHRTLLPGVNS
ncbi:hypothetical protein LDENG_00298510, partial [Lucifuga dentata]